MHRLILLHIPSHLIETVKPPKPSEDEVRSLYDTVQGELTDATGSVAPMAGIINRDKFQKEMHHHLQSMHGDFFKPMAVKSVEDNLMSSLWGKGIADVAHDILGMWSEEGSRAYELLDLASPELAHVMTEEDYGGTLIDVVLRIFGKSRYKYGRATNRDVLDAAPYGVAIFDARYYVNDTPLAKDDDVSLDDDDRVTDPLLRRSYQRLNSTTGKTTTVHYSSLESTQVKALVEAEISHVFFVDEHGQLKLGRAVCNAIKYDWYAIGGRWGYYLSVEGSDQECHGGLKSIVQLPWDRIDVGWVREVLQQLWNVWHTTDKPIGTNDIREKWLSEMSDEERTKFENNRSNKRYNSFCDNVHIEYRDQPAVQVFEQFWKDLTITQRPTKENPDIEYRVEYKVPSTADSPTTLVDGIVHPSIRYCINPVTHHGLSVDELLAVVLAQTVTPPAVIKDASEWIELPDSYDLTAAEATKRMEMFKSWYESIADDDMIVTVDLHY